MATHQSVFCSKNENANSLYEHEVLTDEKSASSK